MLKQNKNNLTDQAPWAAPARLCCGERHFGSICADGKVMCSLCFERFPQDKLNTTASGKVEDVCHQCAELEKIYPQN